MRNDGGPAFPGGPHHVDAVPDQKTGGMVSTIYGLTSGMTLRDYFAAKALQGLLAEPGPQYVGEGTLNEILFESTGITASTDATLADHLAEASYALADAMLKAREA